MSTAARQLGRRSTPSARSPPRTAGLRVLVREPIAEAGVDVLRARYDVDVDTEAPLEEIIDRYDAIVIRSATRLTRDLIERSGSR